MKNTIKEYALIVLGLIILTVGLCAFLIPSNLAVGGVTGFAMVISTIFPQISIAGFMFIINIVLFILGFIAIGKQFGGKTIFASFTLSGLIGLYELILPNFEPIVDDMFLNLFFGIFISGIGMAIVFYQNASTGGTDIIARIINKYFDIEIGKSLLIADATVVIMAIFIYGPKPGLYATLGVFMNAFLIDNIIEGMNLKISVTVISTQTDELKKYIISELDRGATIYKAQGAFTDMEKPVLNTVLNKRQFIKLKKFIQNNDPTAFVMVGNVREVIGEGFKITL